MESHRIVCKYCLELGKTVTFSAKQGYYKHRKINHPEKIVSMTKNSVAVTPKTATNAINNQVLEALIKANETNRALAQEIKELKEKVICPPATQNITQITNNNNTVNVYFNKDLKYYPELVKLLGRKKTCDYLLFTMPESKDIFGVLDKLFIRDGVSYCPIRVSEDDEFVITRGNNEFVHDPTGELIDKENKSKLQDAVLSAYIDSTKHLDDECEKIRRDRVNGEYNEHDMETINKRFDGAIEPSRPYEVMDAIKPKKKDFDKLRKICPKVIKKMVIC